MRSFLQAIVYLFAAGILMAELKSAREPVASENGKRIYVFKTTPQGDLKAYVYLPP